MKNGNITDFMDQLYEERMKIIEICKHKGIPYSGVLRNPRYFEMEACPSLCEDCHICSTEDN